jgi:hypothetical protein
MEGQDKGAFSRTANGQGVNLLRVPVRELEQKALAGWQKKPVLVRVQVEVGLGEWVLILCGAFFGRDRGGKARA